MEFVYNNLSLREQAKFRKSLEKIRRTIK